MILRALAAVFLLTGSAALAETPRLSVEAHAAWQAVGRVNNGGFRSRGLCTGSLVAPEWVLTAGHCVDGGGTPRRYMFVAGRLGDSFVAHRRVVEVVAHPDRDRGAPLSMAQLPFDIALLRLEAPITEVPPLELAPEALSFTPPDALGFVAYATARGMALEGRFDCPVEIGAENIIQLGCTVRGGNSGAPVLLETEQGWRIVAVLVARAGDEASLAAIPTNSLLEALQK